MQNVNILLRDEKCLPTKAHNTDAGYDLKSMEQRVVYPNQQKIIDTGINLQLPIEEQWIWQAQIRPRSGLAAKKNISITNSPGTIDAEYTGDIKVIIRNNGNVPFEIHKYDRIAQIIITKIPKTKLNIVSSIEQTARGDNGFGSSGIN